MEKLVHCKDPPIQGTKTVSHDMPEELLNQLCGVYKAEFEYIMDYGEKL